MNQKQNETVLFERQIPVAFWVYQALKAGTIVCLPSAIIQSLNALTSKGVVTTERVSLKWGFIGSEEFDAAHDKIASVSSSQGLFGKIFNYGFVVITNTGADKFLFFTAAPQQAKALIFDAQEKYKEQQMQKQAGAMARAMKAS